MLDDAIICTFVFFISLTSKSCHYIYLNVLHHNAVCILNMIYVVLNKFGDLKCCYPTLMQNMDCPSHES